MVGSNRVLGPRIVGESAAIRQLVRLIDGVAASNCAVLIEGESGTGKELIARRLHAQSGRSGEFLSINCAGLGEGLFESQLFGHVRGSFTGAQQSMLGLIRTADGGTLCLDEIGEMPLSTQPKLLRVLQEGEVRPVGQARAVQVDTRFVASTNRSLRQMVRDGGFREDLYYRLNVVRLIAPPLRDRREDIPLLLEHFIERAAGRYDRPAAALSPTVVRGLCDYDWPGNVRELSAWVERLYATQLPDEVLLEMLLADHEPDEPVNPARPMSLDEAERRAIITAMHSADQNQSKAAELLNIHRNTLSRKLKQYALS